MPEQEPAYANRYGTTMEAIFEFVREHGPVTIRDVSEASGAPYSHTKVYLHRLVRSRWLHRPERGVYDVSPAAPDRFFVEDYETGAKAMPTRKPEKGA